MLAAERREEVDEPSGRYLHVQVRETRVGVVTDYYREHGYRRTTGKVVSQPPHSHPFVGQVVLVKGASEKLDRAAVRPDGTASFDVADGPDIQSGQCRQLSRTSRDRCTWPSVRTTAPPPSRDSPADEGLRVTRSP